MISSRHNTCIFLVVRTPDNLLLKGILAIDTKSALVWHKRHLWEPSMIKVAISSNGRDLYSPIDPEFDRCAYFLIVNPENLNFEFVPNHGPGRYDRPGANTVRLLAAKGVGVVITGHCGNSASCILSKARIRIVFQSTGTVQEAVKNFWRGECDATEKYTIPTDADAERAATMVHS